MKEHIYKVIVDELARISNKSVEFGFIEDYDFGTQVLLEGKFIVMPSNLNAETIAPNHKKRYDRTIRIIYVKSNSVNDNSMNELIEIEKILHKLNESEAILQAILNMNYNVSINLIKENPNDLTGVLNIEINLYIKES